MSDRRFTFTVHDSIGEIDPAQWDGCACPETADGGRPFDPFTTHRFLSALERSQSVGPGTGWIPRPVSVSENGRIVGVAPLYLKSHSQGEYVFDHAWARALEQAGGRYYPKLQIAVPFTPVTGRRLLMRPDAGDAARAALLRGAVELAERSRLSSLHVTFCTGEEATLGSRLGLLPRIGQQFHWTNEGYADFEDFLAALSARKRKAIRRERRTARAFGGEIVMLTGADIAPRHWDAFWKFYQDTGARKWGTPYLTREFFDILHQEMRDLTLLTLAVRDDTPVAGALHLIGRDTLFGRYWGRTEHHPFLHFELCYYRAIEHAIAEGFRRIEAGAQGAHKIARGYLPVETRSLHWIREPAFRDAISRFLDEETRAVLDEAAWLAGLGPFRHGG